MDETFWCESCAAYVDASAVVVTESPTGAGRLRVCPRCRRHVRREVHERVRPLARVLAEGALWPLGAHAMPALAANGVAAYLLIRYASLFGLGPAVALAAILVHGATVMRATIDGEDEMPAPAEIAGWDHVIGTMARYALVLAVGLAPAIALGIASADRAPGEQELLVLAGLVAGALYLPAAVIRVARAQSVLAVLDPITPLRIAVRIGPSYLVGVAAAWITAALWLALSALAALLASTLDFVPVVPGALAMAVVVAGVLAVARVLGLLVREHRHELGLS